MPMWAWLLFPVVIASIALSLWQAWDKKYVKYGIFKCSLESSPFNFWFFVTVFTIANFSSL